MRGIPRNHEPQPVFQIIESSAPPASAETTRSDNHIYFYSEIDSGSILALIRELRRTDVELRQERVARQLPAEFPPTPIWLHVQSPGGYTPAALSAADTICGLASPVYSVIEGMAYSGGTILSMAAVRRYIQPMAAVMIHQLSGEYWGTYQQMQDQMKGHDITMTRLKEFYRRHSHMSAEQVEDLLGRDSWLTTEECLRLGIVDEVLS